MVISGLEDDNSVVYNLFDIREWDVVEEYGGMYYHIKGEHDPQ